ADLADARVAVAGRDLAALGEIAERSCLKMHAAALAARPGVLYWTGATVDGFHAVRALRAAGVPVWFTNDAGPHVKALCAPADAPPPPAWACPGSTRRRSTRRTRPAASSASAPRPPSPSPPWARSSTPPASRSPPIAVTAPASSPPATPPTPPPRARPAPAS